MSLDLGTVVTRVTVGYGYPDPVTGVRPTVVAENTTQAARCGWRDYRAGRGPGRWRRTPRRMPTRSVTPWTPRGPCPPPFVDLGDATDADTATIGALDLGHWVELPTLLPGAPLEDHTSPILGYTESLSAIHWQIDYHLAPSTLPVPGGAA